MEAPDLENKLNLIKQQDDDDYSVIDKIYLHVKYPNEAKYHYLIKKRENSGLKRVKNPVVALTEYSNNIQGVYRNIKECIPSRKCNVLLVFDNMIANMTNNKKINQIVTELFFKGRKLNISAAFITKSYFKVSKDAKLNFTRFFIMKILEDREL